MRRTRYYTTPRFAELERKRVQPRPHWASTMAKVFAIAVGCICTYALFMFLAVNWLSQCGSRIYTDAYTWQMGECFSMATIVTEWLW